MDTIRELLARLTELTNDELADLKAKIVEEFDRTEGSTPEAVAVMQELADALTSVKGETDQRAEAQAEAERQAEETRQRVKSLLDEGEGEGESGEPAPVADEGETEGEGETEEVTAPEGAPVVASTTPPIVSGRASRMARGGAAPATPAAPRGLNLMAALTASGSLRGAGVNPGDLISDRFTLAEAMAETLKRMPKGGAPRGDVIVASARWEYPADRILGHDPIENERKIEAVTSPRALVASGGVCLPVNVDYAVPTWATAERPLKTALPAFQVDRGGLTYVTPPTLASTSGATTVWTEANDANPTSPTVKPVLQVACGTPQTVYVNAIPTRLQFGNMQGRFAPEQVAANTDLAIAYAARVAELELLSLIDASSTIVESPQFVGATRDVLATLDLSCAAYRYRNRIPESQRLTAIFPAWAKDLFRADLTRQLATSATEFLAVADTALDDWFSVRGINVIWMLDGRPVRSGHTVNWAAQTFGTQSSDATLVKWPVTSSIVDLVFNLFVEGTMQVLDGGQLDLGIVRDSTLDATNDYETFVEPFEGLAFRGVEALLVHAKVLPNGASSATVAATGYTPGD